MPEIRTLSLRNKPFSYTGSVEEGVTLHYYKSPEVSAEFFKVIREEFAGRTIKGGFRDKYRFGFGEWVYNHSPNKNLKYRAIHASYIAAILVHEGYATSRIYRRAVYLNFPELLEESTISEMQYLEALIQILEAKDILTKKELLVKINLIHMDLAKKTGQ